MAFFSGPESPGIFLSPGCSVVCPAGPAGLRPGRDQPQACLPRQVWGRKDQTKTKTKIQDKAHWLGSGHLDLVWVVQRW